MTLSIEDVAPENGSTTDSVRFIGRWKWSELLLLGGIFLSGLLILTIHLLTWGWTALEESNRYVTADCVVLKLYRHSRTEKDGALFYRPEVRIAYEANGRGYEASAYDRTTMTPDGGFVYTKEGADAVLARYKLGQTYPCKYSADDPSFVLLTDVRSFWGWWFLLIPGILILFGAGGLIWCRFQRRGSPEKRRRPKRKNSLYPTVPETLRFNDSPGTQLAYRLPLAFFPVAQMVVAVILAVLWNLLAWGLMVYTFYLADAWLDYLLTVLFGLVFCGTGLAFFPRLIRRLRSTWEAGATRLEISDHPIFPGRKYRLALLQNGRLNVKQYSVTLSCEEIARYRQGTDTVTNRRRIVTIPLFSKQDWTIVSGETVSEEFLLNLPIGAMHSFSGENNQVLWRIEIEMELLNGGIVRRNCPLVVMPFSPSDDLPRTV